MTPLPPLPRLIALDLDGTLLGSDRRVSPRTRRALTRLHALGTVILICTGRPRRTALPILHDLALGDVATLYNGALICDIHGGRVLKSYTLEPATVLEAVRAVQARYPGAMAAVETLDGWFTDPVYYAYRSLHSELLSEPDAVGALDKLVTAPVVKLLFRHPTEPSSRLAEGLAGLPVHGTWAFDMLLEVSAAGVTKANALAWLSCELDVPAAAVAAFGDQHNDKEMLRWAGFGVAMGNAVPEAKAAADFVSTHHDDEGVARVLERWLD